MRLSKTPYFKNMVRAMQVLDQFDRVCLTVLLSSLKAEDAASIYGTVSGRVSEFFNDGYIDVVLKDTSEGIKALQNEYTEQELKQNPDLKGVKLNFSKSPRKFAVVYEKSAKWPDFMRHWRDFLNREERGRA